jgi:hypothetical protein
MKKFEIIEEGRLNKSEMNEVMGGAMSCGLGGFLYCDTCCASGTTGKNSSCIAGYSSCNNTNKMSCERNYNGPTGPGGYTQPANDPAIKVET